jgi:hypothetical protein
MLTGTHQTAAVGLVIVSMNYYQEETGKPVSIAWNKPATLVTIGTFVILA